MPFTKGDPKINRQGRKPGTPNKTTEEMRAVIGDIITENLPRIRKAIKNMDDDKLVMVVERLLKHYLPAPVNSIEQFSEEDLDILIDRLKSKYSQLN